MAQEISKILTVDDDQGMLLILSRGLQSAGYTVTTAESGEQALSILKSLTPDLIIADVMMPGMNGYELCRKVRSSGFDDIPFIFCSALGKIPERVRGLYLGADDYIVKPVSMIELLLKVEKLLEKSKKLKDLKNRAKVSGADEIMAGNLLPIKAAEILQILTLIGLPELCFHVQAPDGRTGEIYIEKNSLVHAQCGPFVGLKAFCKIIAWRGGTYSVDTKKWDSAPTLSGKLEAMLFEAAVQVDEFYLLYDKLKEKGSTLKIDYTPELLTRVFTDNTAMMLNLISTQHVLDEAIDASPYTDLETVKIITELVAMGIVTIT